MCRNTVVGNATNTEAHTQLHTRTCMYIYTNDHADSYAPTRNFL